MQLTRFTWLLYSVSPRAGCPGTYAPLNNFSNDHSVVQTLLLLILDEVRVELRILDDRASFEVFPINHHRPECVD